MLHGLIPKLGVASGEGGGSEEGGDGGTLEYRLDRQTDRQTETDRLKTENYLFIY